MLYLIRFAVEGCKNGQGSLAELHDEALLFYEEDRDDCKVKINKDPFTLEQLEEVITQASQTMGFNVDCTTNKKKKKKTKEEVCEDFCNGKPKDDLGVDMEEVCIALLYFSRLLNH